MNAAVLIHPTAASKCKRWLGFSVTRAKSASELAVNGRALAEESVTRIAEDRDGVALVCRITHWLVAVEVAEEGVAVAPATIGATIALRERNDWSAVIRCSIDRDCLLYTSPSPRDS